MEIRWLTAFIDRPAASFDAAAAFWQAVTGSTLSTTRGDDGEFATLLPPDGDAHLRIQRVRSGAGGTHLDLHVDDVEVGAQEALAAGATRVPSHDDIAVLHSLAGTVLCLVPDRGERVRPSPRSLGGAAHRLLVDQVCVDISGDRFDDECRFWERLTGWSVTQSPVRPEFSRLDVPAALPLLLLLQRRNDSGVPPRMHLDLACEDRDALATGLEGLGARLVERFERWIVMEDPSGVEFCATGRDPATGGAPAST